MNQDKIREILEKLTTGGFLSRSCDTDDVVEKALSQITPKIDEGKIANLILKTNHRDYCRACEPCSKPPCQRIKELAHAIATSEVIRYG